MSLEIKRKHTVDDENRERKRTCIKRTRVVEVLEDKMREYLSLINSDEYEDAEEFLINSKKYKNATDLINDNKDDFDASDYDEFDDAKNIFLEETKLKNEITNMMIETRATLVDITDEDDESRHTFHLPMKNMITNMRAALVDDIEWYELQVTDEKVSMEQIVDELYMWSKIPGVSEEDLEELRSEMENRCDEVY